jgi:hypothetical protein
VSPGVRGAGTGALLSSIHETQAHQGNRAKEPYRNSVRHTFRCFSNAATVPSTIADLSCYKVEMAKTIEQWLLFKYVDGEFTPLSKPLMERRFRFFDDRISVS